MCPAEYFSNGGQFYIALVSGCMLQAIDSMDDYSRVWGKSGVRKDVPA
jgi:hypothetical protein